MKYDQLEPVVPALVWFPNVPVKQNSQHPQNRQNQPKMISPPPMLAKHLTEYIKANKPWVRDSLTDGL